MGRHPNEIKDHQRKVQTLFKIADMKKQDYVKATKPDCQLASIEFLRWCHDMQHWLDLNTKSEYDLQVIPGEHNTIFFTFEDPKEKLHFKLTWGMDDDEEQELLQEKKEDT